jgi:hypothetical protein
LVLSGCAPAIWDAGFLLGFEGGAAEDIESGEGAAGEDRPQYGVDPGAVLFQAQIREIPEGERPDNDDKNANDDQDKSEDEGDGHDAGGEAFVKEHSPVLVVRVGAPWGALSRALG